MFIVFYCAFFPTENKENKENTRIRVSDLIKLPKIDPSTQKVKRKAPASAPSYHLLLRNYDYLLRKQILDKKQRIKRRKNLIKLKKKQ